MRQKPQDIFLSDGQHDERYALNGAMTVCAMEYVAYIAGEKHSDNPECVSGLLRMVSILVNDNRQFEDRQALRPLLVRMVGTANDGQEEARKIEACDWLFREALPQYLKAVLLPADADSFINLPKLRNLTGVETGTNYAKEFIARVGRLTDELIDSTEQAKIKEKANRGQLEIADFSVHSGNLHFALGHDTTKNGGVFVNAGKACEAAITSMQVYAEAKVKHYGPDFGGEHDYRQHLVAKFQQAANRVDDSAEELLKRMVDPLGWNGIPLPYTEQMEAELEFMARR